MRNKLIWLSIKLLVMIIIVSVLWWKYTCHKAYIDYSGHTENTGAMSAIFNIFSKE